MKRMNACDFKELKEVPKEKGVSGPKGINSASNLNGPGN